MWLASFLPENTSGREIFKHIHQKVMTPFEYNAIFRDHSPKVDFCLVTS